MSRQRRTVATRPSERGQWASKTEYLLVVAGNVVGLGNVWRFPYLCYKNGGGAFLVPYVVFALLFGVPLFLLETSLGQFTQEGCITCWRKMCPLAQGIGYGHMVIKLYDFSYILVQVWALFYLVSSFQSPLPWATCNNTWNTEYCVTLQDSRSPSENLTSSHTTLRNVSSSAVEFWERRMLGMSSGIEELGAVRWDLALCLLASWVFCYFSIWKGVRSSGKVAYLTATFPYVILLLLLIRGLTLPGAVDGIYFYLYPNIRNLANLEVWIEAGSQIFFSYSLAVGTLNVLGSYNEYSNNCYKDCFWLCLLNSGTSFVAGFVVFSVLGFMAHQMGVTVDAVAESGPGLAFIAYPMATAMMPLPQFWTASFFLMLVLLAVDTHFVTVESFITTVVDMYARWFRAPMKREMFALAICAVFFLVHLVFVTEGGIYIFQLTDFYGSTRACQDFIAICECVAIGWIFGADRFMDLIEEMTGQRPCVFFKLCWKFITPSLLLFSLLLYCIDYQHIKFNDWYIYPDWAYKVGVALTMSSVVMVPLWAVGQMFWTPGTCRERWLVLCRAEDPAWTKRKTEEESRLAESYTAVLQTSN